MPSLAELMKQKLKEQKESKTEPEVKITPGKKTKISVKEPDIETKPKKILGDKDLDRDQMIPWLQDYLEENKKNFTLDWLRGIKLTFECVNEMRKQRKVNK